jgi:methionyl-tRNA formyltransferase
MKLDNVGLIATETSRSFIYLQSLLANELIPSRVLLLSDETGEVAPGQQPNGSAVSKYLITNKIDHDVLRTREVNHKSVIDYLHNLNLPEIYIYSGYAGAILGKEILSLGKKFLHIHGGYLPKYKGSTTFYYSILEENCVGYSAIFLSEKIDAGQILLRRKFPIPTNLNDFDHIEDPKLRATTLIEVLLRFIKTKKWNETIIPNIETPYYYIIHPVLKNLAIASGSINGI